MFATVETYELRGRDESLKRFVDARDLPPELQRETLEQLFRSASGELRQRALRAGAAVLPDETLVGYLRNDADDVLRNAGLEMLKLRGRRAFQTAVTLLSDTDTDVVLQAVLVLDAIRDPRAWPHLRGLLRHEDPNVVQATIMAAGHLAGGSASRDIVPFLSGEPWLQVAATQALGDLRATSAVAHLTPLLSDPFLQQFAAEALARIGDSAAFQVLANYWMSTEHESEPRLFLELLAGILTQLERPPRNDAFLAAVERYLGVADRSTAVAAAWCVLTLGSCDETALDLISASGDDMQLPPSLAGRSNLIPRLIRRDPPMRDWGYELLKRFPAALSGEALARCISEFPPSKLDALGALLAPSSDKDLVAPLLALWIERIDDRDKLTAAIRRNARSILDLMPAVVSAGDRLALLEALGGAPADIADELSALGEEDRWDAVAAVRNRAVAKRLPWSEWMAGSNRDTAARHLADILTRTNCRDLLPLVRSELAARPHRDLVEAVGDVRDGDSVPILTALLQHNAPLLRAAVFDSLGRIGGPNARAVLRSYCVAEGADSGQACRALAMCAAEADTAILRAGADSADLSVRLAIIAPLISFPEEENRRVLRRMLFDPSAAVAQKAHSVLDLAWSVA